MLERDPAEKARRQMAAGRPAQAAESIEQAVRKQPRNVALRVEAAAIQRAADKTERAVLHLEVAQSIQPGDAEISILLGDVEHSRGNATDAYVAFRRAVSLAPDDVRAVSGLALAADALGFDEEAVRNYERWAELEAAAATRGTQ
jgi:Flp pilus assembly protein TadD